MFQRIVLAVDGWEQALGGVAAAIDLAAGSSAQVLIVHVHDNGLVSRQTAELDGPEAGAALGEIAAEVLTRRAACERRRLRVNAAACVAEGILRAAADFRGDSIVLGLRSSGSFGGQPLGSVAHRVIQRAGCPVVVVRSPAPAAAEAARGGAGRGP
jgi:nucleotide-binding universal stress UspA family protein